MTGSGLRRVSDGGVTTFGGWWLDGGHRVPGYVSDALTRLRASRLLALGDPAPWGMARAALTDAGTARFEQLRQQALGVSADQLTADCRGFEAP